MACIPFPFNATRQIPKPEIKPCPWPVQYWNPNSIVWQIDPSGLPANVPNPNPGGPNVPAVQWDRYGYHGFPEVPVESFVP